MTTYRYERVWWQPWTWFAPVDSMTAVEPEFDDEQREMLISLDEWERDIGPHGHPMSEATSPEADPNNREGKYRYEVGLESAPGLPLVAYDAKAIGDAQEAYYKQYPDVSRNGHLWFARRVER